MPNWITMRDYWTFKPLEVQKYKRHLFECRDSKEETNHSLLVHVAATHAGIVNGNRRMYRPDKMQEGTPTWLPEKSTDGLTTLRSPRPVLIGHNEEGEVLGRVLEAKYVDESWKYAGDFPVVKDFLFYQRDGRKRQTLFQATDWIVDNLLPLDDYAGLGYIDLGLKITNPSAIRKVLADEYLNVSVGFKTDSAICSLCHTDWAVDGKCGHKLGEMEDGRSMFLIAGTMHNQEVSFVNFPSDIFATTLSKQVLTDSLSKMFFLGLPTKQQDSAIADGLQFTDGLVFESDMAATEEPMLKVIDMSTLDYNALSVELKSSELTQERATTVRDSLLAWVPTTEELKTSKRSLISTVNAKIRKNKWDKVQDAVSTDAAAEEELKAMMADATVKPAEVVPAVEIAAVDFTNWTPASDLDRDYFADSEGIQTELVAAGLTDSATEGFCGPRSSFPVTTEASATAARKVLAGAQISDGLKADILTNINLKFAVVADAVVTAEETAITTETQTDAQVEATYLALIDAVLLTDAEGVAAKKTISPETRSSLIGTIRGLDTSYKSLPTEAESASYYDSRWVLRSAIRSMLELWSSTDEFEYAMARLAQNKDQVVLSRSEVDEKDETINGLMSEKDALQVQLTAIQDSRTLILAASKKTMAQQIVMHHVLKGQDGFRDLTPDQVNEKVSVLSKRHITSLKDAVSDILGDLKFIDSVTAPKPTEVIGSVPDNTKITPSALEMTDKVVGEADKALVIDPRANFRFLSNRERQIEEGKLRLQAALTK
jgi:hypothetical protein